MKKFLVFIERKPGFTGASLPDHRNFLQSLRKQELLASAGGFADQTGGAYIILADTYDDAVQLVNQDPMKAANECVYSVKEWNVQ